MVGRQPPKDTPIVRAHPLALFMITRLVSRGATSDHVVEEGDLRDLGGALDAIAGREEFRHAVVSLLNLASALERQGSPRAAKPLYTLLESQPILDALDRLNAARSGESRDQRLRASEAMARFSDDRARHVAPNVSEMREGDLKPHQRAKDVPSKKVKATAKKRRSDGVK